MASIMQNRACPKCGGIAIEDDIDQENSYLVSYSDGKFTILFGDVPEKYRISYEEYQKKGYINIITL